MPTSVVPKASPETLPELATSLEPCTPLFRRSTSRKSVERSLTGLLPDLPRKNCDTIAAAVEGTSTERLQPLVTDATWEPHKPRHDRLCWSWRGLHASRGAQRLAPGPRIG
jgi:hypothetical protein